MYVRDVRYAGAAGAVMFIGMAFFLEAHTMQKIMGLCVVMVTVAVFINRSIAGDPDADVSDEIVGRTGTKQPQVRGDMFYIRTSTGNTALTSALFPDIAEHLNRIHAQYARSNRGTIDAIASDTEHFSKKYSKALLMKRSNHADARPLYQDLQDLRINTINSMITLLYAKPHAHPSRIIMMDAIRAFKQHSLRCLRLLHNKFGQHGLQALAPMAPRSYDPSRHEDPFAVHV
jgi:hypothetical protein